jgi:hypothetical protein
VIFVNHICARLPTRYYPCVRARRGFLRCAAGSPNASKGYLSEILDTTDKTTYLRDGFGRVVKKTQQLAIDSCLDSGCRWNYEKSVCER